MAVNLSPVAGAATQFFDNSGAPLSGGFLHTYAAGTTTPLATYTSASGAVANSNPIVLNSAGRLDNEVWLTTPLTYKFILKNSNNVTIATYDDIPGIGSVSGLTSGTSILYGNGSGGFSNVVIGANLSFVSGTLSATAGGGSGVTSVALTAPAAFTVTGSPVTSTGTLAVTYSGNPIPITSGGTGVSTIPSNAIVVGPATGPGATTVQFVAPGTANNVLTSNGTTWTSTPPTIPTTALAIGTYCFAYATALPSGILYPGDTIAGSFLIATSSNNIVDLTTNLPGTWQCMGYTEGPRRPTLFLRIS
jgi:hypothetical protein